MVNRAAQFAQVFIKNCKDINKKRYAEKASAELVAAFYGDFKATMSLIVSDPVRVMCLQGYYQMWQQICALLQGHYSREILSTDAFGVMVQEVHPTIYENYYEPNLIEK